MERPTLLVPFQRANLSLANAPQMSYFLYKLVPPRETFAQTMSESEIAIMQRHVAYWSRLFSEGAGSVVAFGPVADPKGGYGIAILEAHDEADIERLIESDPAMSAGVGFRCEIHAMPRAFARLRH